MLWLAGKRMGWSRSSRVFLQRGPRLSTVGGYLQGQIGCSEGFCSVASLSELSETSVVSDVSGDSTARERWAKESVLDGLSGSAAQRRSLRKANTQPLSELERACIQMLWRRNISEPIEVTLQKAQFPLTAANLGLVLTHVRNAKDALRLYLCFIRVNPSFVPEKALLDALSRFWRHEPERFPVFTSILNELRNPSFQMTPRKLTSILRGYAWAGLVDDVLEYLSKCEASYGFKPDFVHYSCALHTCVAERRTDIAMEIFEQMKENGSPPTYDTFNSLINGLLNMKQDAEAGMIFEQMFACKLVKPGELPCRVVSYVSIVEEMLRSQDMKNVSVFLLRMNDMGFVPDYFTCAEVLNAYTLRGLLQEQRELFSDLIGSGIIPDIARIRKFVKDHNTGNLSPESQKLLSFLVATLEEASKSGKPITTHTSGEVARELGDNSSPGVTEAKPESLNHDSPPSTDGELEKTDILIFDRIIYGLCVREKAEDAFELLQRLVNNTYQQIIPSAATSAILFDGLCWNLAWEAAELCLRMMMQWRHMPELKVFNAWVVGSAKANLLENVMNVLNEFSDRNLSLDVTSYNILIDKFCMAGKLEEAMSLTREVKLKNGTPDVVSYSRMIQSFAKVGNFETPRKLLAEMVERKITPYALPFTPLVQRLCLSGKVDEALEFVDEIEQKGCRPLSSLYTIIVSALCRADRLQDAFDVVDIMKAKGVTPEVQTHKDLFGSCMGTRSLKPVVHAQ